MSVQERHSMVRLKKELVEYLNAYHIDNAPRKRGSFSLKHSFIEATSYVFFLELNTINCFKIRRLLKSKVFEEFVATLCGEVQVWKDWTQRSTLIRIRIVRKA